MNSKQIRDECKQGDSVVSAGRTWGAEFATRRAAQLAKRGLGGAPTEAALCAAMERDMRALAVCGEQLQEADIALDHAELAGPGAQARRDEAQQRTYQGLVEVRELVTAVAGDAAAAELGFEGTTPRDPVAVEELAQRVVMRARVVTVTPRRAGVTLDLDATTAALAADHKALAEANAELREVRRREQLARSRRDELWAEYTRERSTTAARLDADLRAVGLDDVADRLVPVARKAVAEPAEGADAAKSGARKVAKAAEKKPADAKPASPVVTSPAINTRPSQAPVSPS